MLIKCPRCGFQQPKDKYCAQCGVDIENFKPPTQPLFKKIFGNPILQLSVLLITAGVLGLFIYQKTQDSLRDRVTYLKSTVQINSSDLTPPPPPPPTDMQASDQASKTSAAGETPTTSAPPASPASSAKVDGDTAKNSAASKDSTKEPKDTKETRGLANVQAPHLTVYYAEVSRGVLNSIFESSQSTGQFMSFKDYSAGILPGIGKRLNNASIKILHKEERSLDSSKTLQWFYGLKDRTNPSVEIGLTTFFEISDMESGNLRGNFEIQRTWREQGSSGAPEIQRKSFPAIFEIGSGTGFFLSGVMPTQSLLDNEDELTSIDIYKILRSPQFRSGDSDFVIFIEFTKGN